MALRTKTLLVLLLVITLKLTAKEVYVSPSGNDNNPGTISEPVKSLSVAFNLVKDSPAGSKIFLRGGIHNVNSVVNLSAQYSGSAQSPLVVCSYPGEKAIVNGGLPIPSNKFRELTNNTRLKRIPALARGKVYVAQLFESQYNSQFPAKSDYNVSAMISWDGYVLNEAQYPNKGYAYIQQVSDVGPTTRWLKPGESPAAYSETNPTGAKFELRDQLDWSMMKMEFDRTRDMLIRGYFSNDWFFQTERIGGIEADGNIQLLRYTRYGVETTQKLPRRVNIYGALCQLDEPGEWYFDKAENLLYIWPVLPITDSKPVILAGKNKLIECTERLENVAFKNIIFENFSDHALRFTNAGNVKVLGCEFRSGNGVCVRLQGDNNLIQSCDFHDTKGSFVLNSSGAENVVNLVNDHNAAINNHIHHIWNRGYGGCSIGGVGARFANNLIHDTNGALVYGNNDCIVEFNEFYNMGYEMGDWNPMYRGADFTSLGNQVRYNFVHHLMETPYGYPIAGIRNDDCGHGLHVHHNIFFKAGRAAVMGHGANNSASHNIVVETNMLWWSNQEPYETLDKALWDSKGDFMQRRYQTYLDKQAQIAAGTLKATEKDNYLGRAEIKLGEKFWENNQVWRNHYPIIDSLYHFFDPDRNPWMQCYDTLINNVMVDGHNYPFHMHGPNKVDAGGIESLKDWLPNTALIHMPKKMTSDQIFNDFENMDISLKSSFTEIQGFVNFNMDTIGLFIDQYRTEMPDKNEYRMHVKNKYEGVPSSGGTFAYDLLNERYNAPEYMKLLITSTKVITRSSQLFEVRYSQAGINIHPKKISKNATLELYRISGQKVMLQQNVSFPYQIAKGTVAPGIYVVRVLDNSEVQTEKIVVQQ